MEMDQQNRLAPRGGDVSHPRRSARGIRGILERGDLHDLPLGPYLARPLGRRVHRQRAGSSDVVPNSRLPRRGSRVALSHRNPLDDLDAHEMNTEARTNGFTVPTGARGRAPAVP